MKTVKGLSLIFLIISFIVLFGCSNSTEHPSSVDRDKIQVITTIFPLYDFAKQIGGDYVSVKSLIPAGVDSHHFEPTAKEMVQLNNADLFIYNGAGYELWVEKTVQNLNQENTKIVDASLGLDFLIGHDEEDATEENHEDDHGHGDYDPHVWLDPMNAKQQAGLILKALIEIAPEHKAAFQANYDRVANDLDQLDAEYQAAFAKAKKKKVVVAHQAFGYLAHRYGFEQIAVSGLSTSKEPSQKELINLIKILKENDLKYVAFDSFVESKIAKTVQREANAEAITLNTIENATKEQLAAGVTYVQLMRENLHALKTILDIQD